MFLTASKSPSLPQGRRYWRFEDGVLDEGYPREISVGFDKVPDYVDAAFALPSPAHHEKEKVFFFRGNKTKQSPAYDVYPGHS